MKKIPLTQSKFALVDDEDFERLSKDKWYLYDKGGGLYAGRVPRGLPRGKRNPVYLHRVVMNAPANRHVDHIDGNGLNNQKSNLRLCTRYQNLSNRKKTKLSTSGFKGVTLLGGKHWLAQIGHKGYNHYLGIYKTPEEAARAYDAGARKYHKEFAVLNFPQ